MTERELLIDCLRKLNTVQIRYMLTGSMASNFWGVPRSTHDLDFVLQIRSSEVDRFARAFERDYFLSRTSIEAAFRPPYQFNVIDTQSGLKIDFWLLRDDPFERSMFNRRVRLMLFGEQAWIATAEDVILHKLYWHSLNPSDRQLSDAAAVLAVQSDQLDR
jgi:hypothetical protein